MSTGLPRGLARSAHRGRIKFLRGGKGLGTTACACANDIDNDVIVHGESARKEYADTFVYTVQ